MKKPVSTDTGLPRFKRQECTSSHFGKKPKAALRTNHQPKVVRLCTEKGKLKERDENVEVTWVVKWQQSGVQGGVDWQ